LSLGERRTRLLKWFHWTDALKASASSKLIAPDFDRLALIPCPNTSEEQAAKPRAALELARKMRRRSSIRPAELRALTDFPAPEVTNSITWHF